MASKEGIKTHSLIPNCTANNKTRDHNQTMSTQMSFKAKKENNFWGINGTYSQYKHWYWQYKHKLITHHVHACCFSSFLTSPHSWNSELIPYIAVFREGKKVYSDDFCSAVKETNRNDGAPTAEEQGEKKKEKKNEIDSGSKQ